MNYNLEFYKGKRVLLTGHTGFKGTWMSRILNNVGASLIGYSLEAPTEPNLFNMAAVKNNINSITGDVRDLNHLKRVFDEFHPEIVIHMAAQPLVREGYKNPVYTYETNVLGTVNILECVRNTRSVRSFLNVTTDKVYENKEWEWGYRENDVLDGYDPYSNSKSCSELITHSYKKSFLDEKGIAVSTVRAGNVIGGGDFAKDRIIPDCVRAVLCSTDIVIRNPFAVRPFQHVLEPVLAYLLIAGKQCENKKFEGSYNIGPDDRDCVTVGRLVEIFVQKWGENVRWINQYDGGPHEANFLKLDCSKIKKVYGWSPRWSVEEAVEKTVEWSKVYLHNGDIPGIMDRQIEEFLCN